MKKCHEQCNERSDWWSPRGILALDLMRPVLCLLLLVITRVRLLGHSALITLIRNQQRERQEEKQSLLKGTVVFLFYFIAFWLDVHKFLWGEIMRDFCLRQPLAEGNNWYIYHFNARLDVSLSSLNSFLSSVEPDCAKQENLISQWLDFHFYKCALWLYR